MATTNTTTNETNKTTAKKTAARKTKGTKKVAAKGTTKTKVDDKVKRTPRGMVHPAWLKIFAAIHALGRNGMPVSTMATHCEKHGVGLYYRRFVKKGFLAPLSRGVYGLTSQGRELVSNNK